MIIGRYETKEYIIYLNDTSIRKKYYHHICFHCGKYKYKPLGEEVGCCHLTYNKKMKKNVVKKKKIKKELVPSYLTKRGFLTCPICQNFYPRHGQGQYCLKCRKKNDL